MCKDIKALLSCCTLSPIKRESSWLCRIQTSCMGSMFPIIHTKSSLVFQVFGTKFCINWFAILHINIRTIAVLLFNNYLINAMTESINCFLVLEWDAMAEYFALPSVQPPTAMVTFRRGLRCFRATTLLNAPEECCWSSLNEVSIDEHSS